MQFPISILVGSEFGTSCDVTKRLSRELTRLGFSPSIHKMDEFPIETLPTIKHVIFVCSTTGQGQPPSNMSMFWNFLLRDDLAPTVLSQISYTIFGLGDSSYPLYNAVARRLDKRLNALGARLFCPLGLGDDQHAMAYDGGFIPWLLDLYTSLLQECHNFYPQLTEMQQNLTNLIAVETASLTDSIPPTSAPNSNSTPTIFTDYLAYSSVSLRVIKHNTFDLDEINELFESPAITEMIYNSIVSTLSFSTHIQPSQSIQTQFNKTQYEQLLSHPTQEQINIVLKLFLQYIGPQINPQTIVNYHQIPIPDLFTNELLFETLYPTFLPSLIPMPSSHSSPNPIQLSTNYKSLPILSTSSLTAKDHFQAVNHITYDISPLIINQTNILNSQTSTSSLQITSTHTPQQDLSMYTDKPSQNISKTVQNDQHNHQNDQYNHQNHQNNHQNDHNHQNVSHISPNSPHSPQHALNTFLNLVESPPYLPGDILEIIPPNPNILINALLTLYNLDPNDLIFISRQHYIPSTPATPSSAPVSTHVFSQTSSSSSISSLTPENSMSISTPTIAPSSPTLPLYLPITCADSFNEYIFELMEKQDEFDEINALFAHDPSSKTTRPKFALQRYDTFPLCIRAWHLFTWYIHTSFTPQRYHFFMLAQQATQPEQKERLTDLCTPSYASTLDSYCIRERRSIVEVFTDFPTALLPLEWIVELCDRIKPRQFSLASSPLYNFIPLIDTSQIASSYTSSVDYKTLYLNQLIPSSQTFDLVPTPLPLPLNTAWPSSCESSLLTTSSPNTFQCLQQRPQYIQSYTPQLTASLCLATVVYTTPFKRVKHGFCSSYLHYYALNHQINHQLQSHQAQNKFQNDAHIDTTCQNRLDSDEKCQNKHESDQNEHQIHPVDQNNLKIGHIFNDVRNDSYTINIEIRPDLVMATSISTQTASTGQYILMNNPNNDSTQTSSCKTSSHMQENTLEFTQDAQNTQNNQNTQIYRILAKIKPGSFRYAISTTKQPQQHNMSSLGTVCPGDDPIIAIGPGTGVAALHSVIEHRFALLIAHLYQKYQKSLSEKNQDTKTSATSHDHIVNLFSLFTQSTLPIMASASTLAQSSSENQIWLTHPSKTKSQNLSETNHKTLHNSSNVSNIPNTMHNLPNQSNISNFIQNSQNPSSNEYNFLNSSIVPHNSLNDSHCPQLYLSPCFLSSNVSTLPPINAHPLFSSPLPPFSILFGCRSLQADHFYRDFFNFAVRFGILTNYQAVFSRTPINPLLTHEMSTNVFQCLQQLHPRSRQDQYQDQHQDQHKEQQQMSLPIPQLTSLRSDCALKAYEWPQLPGYQSQDDNDVLDQYNFNTPHSRDRYVQHRIVSNAQLFTQILNLVDLPFVSTTTDYTIDTKATQNEKVNVDEKKKKMKFVDIHLDFNPLHRLSDTILSTSSSLAEKFPIGSPVSYGGAIIVAGNAKKMPNDVQSTIIDIIYDSLIASFSFAHAHTQVPTHFMAVNENDLKDPIILPFDSGSSSNSGQDHDDVSTYINNHNDNNANNDTNDNNDNNHNNNNNNDNNENDKKSKKNTTYFEICVNKFPPHPPFVAYFTTMGVTELITQNIYGESVVIISSYPSTSSSHPSLAINNNNNNTEHEHDEYTDSHYDHKHEPNGALVRLHITRDDVRKFINFMAKKGRYILECWM